MKRPLYKVSFWATEKIGGGKEYRTLRTVYIPRVDEVTRQRITEEQCKERGQQALLAEHYYDIEYGSTIATELIFA